MTRNSLGKGLAALLGEEDQASSLLRDNAVLYISTNVIYPNKDQPRKIFKEEELKDLSESIKEKGVLQPILVRRLDNNPNHFQIVVGERRWRAAKLANVEKIPVIIKILSNKEVFEISIIENIHRQDLTVIEEAQAYQRLIDEYNYKHEDLAEVLGKSRSHITNLIRLLQLPDKVRQYLEEKKISMGHARALLGVDNAAQFIDKIVDYNLSVRAVETLVRFGGETQDSVIVKKPLKTLKRHDFTFDDIEEMSSKRKASFEQESEINALEQELSKQLDSACRITMQPLSSEGKLIIHWRSIDEFDRLMTKLLQIQEEPNK